MKIIAAVTAKEEFERALQSPVEMLFDLRPNLLREAERIRRAHQAGKRLYAHMDFAEGIGRDSCGIGFLKEQGIDGIISTRMNIIKAAREAGLSTVQRFFIMDSHSVHTIADTLRFGKADMAELMPGVAPKVIRTLKEQAAVPLIAGGLIETREEAEEAVRSGAFAISTGKEELWYL